GKLANVSSAEVGFAYRKVELLLVGRSRLTQGRPRIFSIELKPDIKEQSINSVTKLWKTEDYYVTVGDNQARSQISRKLPSATKKFLLSTEKIAKEMAIRAVSHGIRQCGMHSLYSDIKSCGGETRIRMLC